MKHPIKIIKIIIRYGNEKKSNEKKKDKKFRNRSEGNRTKQYKRARTMI